MTFSMKKTILAYRKYPLPNGTNYTSSDLKTIDQLQTLFDYCQILEAVIYKEGWNFLIDTFGYEQLYTINTQSGWFDSADLTEFKADIAAYIHNLS